MLDKNKKITIKTVAADAGVSVSAVSKVLRNAYGVSDSLRQNVEESIERLGYRPSSAARGMRGKTFTIGVLLVGLENPFLNKVIIGVNEILNEAGYKSMLAVGRAETHIETSLVDSMIDFKMDGIILIGPRLDGGSLERVARNIPMVAVAEHSPDATTFDTVNSDDRFGARLAVQAMIDKGYKDIAMLSLADRRDRTSGVWFEREIGYAETMDAAGLGDFKRISRLSMVQDISSAVVDPLLQDPDRARAYFCWSDLHAIPLINRARAMGLRVPEDIAIIGYDNSPPATMPLINLASVRQSAITLGETAARSILSRISGRDTAEHHLLTPELIVRDSF